MKIYTRGGDRGQTSLIGGQRVAKCDLRLETYGTIDELNAIVGICASLSHYLPDLQKELYQLQHYLFDCGNDFAVPDKGKYPYRIHKELVTWLEEQIDDYTKYLTPITQFILPGGCHLSAQLHHARTVSRRAERLAVQFMQEYEGNDSALTFLNRLSDYFFTLARYVNARNNIKDISYTPDSFK